MQSPMTASSRPVHIRYLLIGAGVAGSCAAEAIRALDADGSLLMVGQEIMRPYHRPPLSKSFLRGESGRDDLLSLPLGWFSANNVQLITGRRVTWIEPDRHRATLDDGTVVQYEQCLLCFGGMVAPLELPGAGLPGLYYLRTLSDAESLITRLQQALRDGRPHPHGRGRAAVVGGGLLGVEVAASLRTRGLWVELLMGGPLPWPEVAGEAGGRFLVALLQKNGIVVHAGNPPTALEGDGRVQRVQLAGGEAVQCDFAVACVGMQVDRRLLQGTSIPMGRAITCDEFARAGADQGVGRIWAAGDCSAILDRRFGKHINQGHAPTAAATGRLAGRNMVHAARGGELEPWEDLPGWDSEVFGISVAGWGLSRLVDRRIVRGNTNIADPDFAEIGIDAAGRVCHVMVAGRASEQESLRRLVADRTDISGRESDLRDPNRPLDAA
jgi:3-phenylpropionate/trans-cinnamate dioxygenase ferredoxin reductase subunit